MAVNPDKLNAFMGKAVGNIGAAMSANMVLLGDKLDTAICLAPRCLAACAFWVLRA